MISDRFRFANQPPGARLRELALPRIRELPLQTLSLAQQLVKPVFQDVGSRRLRVDLKALAE